ncbi:glycoside hydrolase [Schizopora paradoxa]|uniref:glucan endo-1,3-beta-D-glucosidase n=1 Tax=Schizopora paradoxa TaxID=27342 RepID=A0A0H2RD71_9AGAM|nr:glycoside hydrolase [Schizopora paradoxa]
MSTYNAIGQQDNWLEKQQKKSKRTRWIIAGSVTVIIAAIVIGVAVGVTVHNNNSKSSSSDISTGTGGNGTATPGAGNNGSTVPQTNPNDPSSFEKDSRLIKSFYGIAYTPEGSQYPACGNSLSQVINDIQLMSQLTSKIRLYGADCNQSALVLEAIKQTKVDMQVYLANFPIDTDPAPYLRQRDAIVQALQTYGTSNVLGVTVGNEFMLDYLADNGGTDPNSAIGNAGAALLISNITDTRNTLSAAGFGSLPVGTSDAGAYFNNEVMNAIDYGMANVHPWFANVSIDQAAGWTWDFFTETNIAQSQASTKKPQMSIAETGWPTASDDAGNANNGASAASVPNLQTYLDTFVCQANTNGTQYFFFEYFDETWKAVQFGGVEGHWGLFNADRTLKNITIPNCPLS